MQAIETEVIEPSNAIALRPSMSVGQAMGVDEIIAQVHLIQSVMKKVMVEGEHYGTVPGCGPKKVLLQPGAQKLTMTFRLAPAYEIQEVNLGRGHKEYRVTCTLKSMGSGSFVGQGVGCCSSMESKYRWRGGARKCPECGKETIIKGKAEYGGGWLCYQKKGGCGHKWPDGAQEIEGQNIERIENDNPADTFNTVLKMAKKRAFVDATITATAASDIFTQDVGDDGEPEDDSGHVEPPKKPLKTTEPKFTTPTPAETIKTPPSPVSAPKNIVLEPKQATPEQRTKMISVIESQGPDAVQKALGYFIEAGAILPTESLKDVPLYWVPTTQGQMRELGLLIAKLNDTGKAEKPAWVSPGLAASCKDALINPAASFNAEEGEENPFNEAREASEKEPEQEALPMDDEKWRVFPVPYGKHAGIQLGKLPKNTLWGFWKGHKVETEFKGKPIPAEKVKSSREFRAALDQAGIHYEFTSD